jgi:hypothetical protein
VVLFLSIRHSSLGRIVNAGRDALRALVRRLFGLPRRRRLSRDTS